MGDDARISRTGGANEKLKEADIPIRPLMPFADTVTESTGQDQVLPIKEREYLKLVDQTGRIAVRGKRGRIDPSLQPVLSRLGLSIDDWISCSTAFTRRYRNGALRLQQSA